jgi:hypothetical protein
VEEFGCQHGYRQSRHGSSPLAMGKIWYFVCFLKQVSRHYYTSFKSSKVQSTVVESSLLRAKFSRGYYRSRLRCHCLSRIANPSRLILLFMSHLLKFARDLRTVLLTHQLAATYKKIVLFLGSERWPTEVPFVDVESGISHILSSMKCASD